MTGALPPAWLKLAEKAGIRGTHRGIAEAAGVAPTTITRLIFEGRTTPETVTAVANALRVAPAQVYHLADVPQSEDGPWEPPQESQWLDRRQRAALTELIRSMVPADGARRPDEEQPGGGDSVRRKRREARRTGVVRPEADQDQRRAQ